MSKSMSTLAAGASMLLPRVAGAHPGHGPELGVAHYLASPFHLASALFGAAGVVLVVGALRWARRRAPLPIRRSR